MSKHRIEIIAALSAIALCATPSLTAQARSANPPDSTTSSSSSSRNASSSSARPAAAQPTDSDDAATPAQGTSQSSSSADRATTSGSLSGATSSASSSATAGTSGIASSMSDQVTLAPSDAEKSAIEELKGKRVRGSDGSELGKIHDFIIDAGSGKIVHAVISTGGLLGMGDKLRLVPHTNLHRSGDEGFNADLQQSDFKALPTLSSKDLEAGRFTAHLGGQQDTSSSTDITTSSSASAGQLVRASQFEDKKLRSDNSEVGEIDDVVIDFEGGKAMALIEANAGFAGQSGNFLVPFAKLDISSADAETISTSLLKSDFPSAQGVSSTTTTSPSTSIASAPASSTGSSATAGTASASGADTSGSSTPGVSGVASSSATSRPSATSDTSSSSSTQSSATVAADTSTSSRTSDTVSTTNPDTEPTTPGTSSPDVASTGSRTSTPTGSAVASGPSDTSTTRSGVSSPVIGSGRTDIPSQSAGTSGSPSIASSSRSATTPDASATTPGGDTANATEAVATTTPTPPSTSEETLTPTGRTSADQGPASAATVMAIRRAIDADSDLAKENVQVTTRIVLRGTVEDEDAKERVEEIARKAASNAEIDNQITVERN